MTNYSTGGFTFRIESQSIRLRQRAEMVFSDLIRVEGDEFVPDVVFEIFESGERLVLSAGRSESYYPTVEDLLIEVVSAVSRAFLDEDSGRLHLHAAAASLDGEAAILLARSGGGKTTAAIALLSAGWAYHTDETIALSPQTNRIASFPKPLSLRRSGFKLFDEILGGPGPWRESSTASKFPLRGSMISGGTSDSAIPRVLAQLDPVSSDGEEFAHMRPSDAVVALVDQSMDLVRYGSGGLKVLADLAARCRCIHLPRAHPRAMAATIQRVLSGPEPPQLPTQLVECPSDWAFEPVTTLLIGDEAVVRNAGSGRIASLNPQGAETWTRFLERRHHTRGNGFLEQLQTTGILERLRQEDTK